MKSGEARHTNENFCMKTFTDWILMIIMRASFGGIAQLGERLHGMQEVSGSIPLTSTKVK